MASEAQRLIGISLTKIAQSRTHRGGVSLHKNLLVATVLQKARYIFMEEAYNMVHYQVPAAAVPSHQHHRQLQDNNAPGEDLVGLTAEEGTGSSSVEPVSSALPGDDVEDVADYLQQQQQSGCVKCTENQQQQSQDKENQPPYQAGPGELTYLDLDKNSPSVLRERSNCLKRRRAVTEWETEEAVQSILPKRLCSDDSTDDTADSSSSTDSCGDDSVFTEDVSTATVLSETVAKEISNNNNDSSEVETSSSPSNNNNNNAMEIDRITSLVSIFSFGMASASAAASSSSSDPGKLSRSLSTPDLCSAQAKDSTESLQHQQRPFLTMTV